MRRNLKRYYGAGDLHFLTFSCYHRKPLLDTARRRDLFLTVLERTRRRYQFLVVGYVIMPEHVHLLISEPLKNPSTVMQAIKIGFARRVLTQEKRKRDPRQAGLFCSRSATHLAEKVLRLQCAHGGQTDGEAPVHASESSEEGVGYFTGVVALE